ncbi:putative Pentatricopeptide repeat-containing protein [Zostera marina]|uniref:Putative Pentatricopeptide repeat-containing protein n=1 Tax=Zostera marina TaxID=29655 RepID=A0A0K9PZ76_ZOSMR|nr:putative Pentatricopeptide repeat-containing protein [Zostera marina]
MLRANQIGTISQSARSFFLASSKLSPVEESFDDDACASTKSSTNNDSVLAGFAAKQSSNINGIIKAASFHSSKPSEAQQQQVQHSPKSSIISSDLDTHQPNGILSSNNVTSVSSNLALPSKLFARHLVNTSIAKDDVTSDVVSNNGHFKSNDDVFMVNLDSSDPNLRSSNSKAQWINKKDQTSTIAQNKSRNPRINSNRRSDDAEKHIDVEKPQPCMYIAQKDRKPNKSKVQSKVTVPKNNSGRGATSFSENSGYVEKWQRPPNPTMSCALKRKGAISQLKSSKNSAKIVDLFLNTLGELKCGSLPEEALGNLHCKLDSFQANQILKHLHDHSVALGFFNWLRYQPGFKHDDYTYTTMIGILGKAKQFGCIRKLLEEMVRDGCCPNIVTYNRMIHGYGRANHIIEAMGVFHQMQHAGCEPDRVTFCTLIDIHAKAGYLDVAMELYKKMVEVGLCPDTFTYSVMINCLGKAGNLPASYKLFCEMKEMGCVPNLVTYNIMITLQAKSRNYSSALNLYRDMCDAGFHPDKITYSIVMEVLGNCGHLDEVESVFVEMQHYCPPDEPIYGLLVDLWGKAGKVDKARSWYEAMINAGLRPNVPICNSLLSAFLRMERFSDGCYVIENMLDMGLVPSLQTYTLLLSWCTKRQTNIGVMSWCYELMNKTGHPAHVFLSSLPSAKPGGQNVREHTIAFLDLMHSEKREGKRGFVDAVIDFLQKSDFKEEAGLVWEVAASRNIYPDAVKRKDPSYWLINLHVMSDGTAVIALSRTLAWFRKRIIESGICPERIDIITGWGRRSKVTGSSLVRQAVSDLLRVFKSPFYTQGRNSGCFIGCGCPLQTWLLHSFVDRLHLV